MYKQMLWFIVCLLCLSEPGIAGQNAIKAGDHFPDICLTGSQTLSPEETNYLCLSGKKKTVCLRDIRTEFVWVEIFNIYCAACQKDAPKYNKLYELINRDGTLNARVKMLGIGAGNNSREVAYFKKRLKVVFPMFSDIDFKVHNALKKPRTPLLLVLDIRSRPSKVIFIFDPAKEPEALLRDIRSVISNQKLSPKPRPAGKGVGDRPKNE